MFFPIDIKLWVRCTLCSTQGHINDPTYGVGVKHDPYLRSAGSVLKLVGFYHLQSP